MSEKETRENKKHEDDDDTGEYEPVKPLTGDPAVPNKDGIVIGVPGEDPPPNP